jgi:pimeloyl-ACP methyl ester carboxylesterase
MEIRGKVWLLLTVGALSCFAAGAIHKPDRFETSGHIVRFVTVERGVQLEVLDWGGRGDTLVLLAGMGDNAHVFDGFAYQFNDRFHVIGITRRGFGRSSQPANGYDNDTRARDNIAFLDNLKIREAVFAGHSIAGTELNKLGAAYPDRIKKLVYLDGLDNASGGWASLPQPPARPRGYRGGPAIAATSRRSRCTFGWIPKASRSA